MYYSECRLRLTKCLNLWTMNFRVVTVSSRQKRMKISFGFDYQNQWLSDSAFFFSLVQPKLELKKQWSSQKTAAAQQTRSAKKSQPEETVSDMLVSSLRSRSLLLGTDLTKFTFWRFFFLLAHILFRPKHSISHRGEQTLITKDVLMRNLTAKSKLSGH